MWFIDLLKERHSVVNVSIFVSVVKYVQRVGGARIIIFYIMLVSLDSQL
jgi:hypothetical protein